MRTRQREREAWQSPPDLDEYILTARGELLGRVEVPAGARPGLEFEGYFHPARAFSRVVGLFDEYNRAGDRWARLYHSGLTTAVALRRGRQLDMDRAVERAEAAWDLADDALHELGLELTDASGRRLATSLINIECVKLEEESALHDEPGDLEGLSPFEELEAGVDVTPYRLSACSRDKDAPAGTPARKPLTAVPWRPEEDLELDAALEAWESATEGSSPDYEDDPDAELEWEGGSPSLEDRITLWRRAAGGHPRDTLLSNLDLAGPMGSADIERDRDVWVKSVQLARARGFLGADLADYLIWSIVTEVEDHRYVEDPNGDELLDRRVAFAQKLGVEMEDLDRMTDPPAEWLTLQKASHDQHTQRVSEVLLSAGETSLAAAMRDRPEEFEARMDAWDERVRKEHEEKQRR